MRVPMAVLRVSGASVLASHRLSSSKIHMQAPQAFIDDVNTKYDVLHRNFEEQVVFANGSV